MKIAILSAHPAPYRDRLLSIVEKNLGGEVKIFTLFPDDGKHDFGNRVLPYSTEFIATRRDSGWRIFIRLTRKIVFGRFDFILWACYVHWYEKAAILLCILMGKRYGFGADSVAQPKIGRLAWRIKRMVVRNARLIHVPGKMSKRFFVDTFDVHPSNIVTGSYALEGNALENRIVSLREQSTLAERDAIGVHASSTVFLMVANMLPTRHYPVLCRAFVKFASSNRDSVFLMVGTGPELGDIQALAKKHQCLKVIAGCPFDRLVSLYALSNVYVHGGVEPASSALVMGAIAHLPLIASSSVGCQADVVVDGESGILVKDYLSEQEWVDAFQKMSCMKGSWEEMGKRARELSRSLDLEETYSPFLNALKKVCEK